MADFASLLNDRHNVILLGEGGCGKSEVALNLAAALAGGARRVHLFDMDQTKPLFRTREHAEEMERLGVRVHYQVQFYDAPTLVGGVESSLRDPAVVTILDVGGDAIGARMIGGFAEAIEQTDALVLYLINPYRAWSSQFSHTDETFSSILYVSRLKNVHIFANPHLGPHTTLSEVVQGLRLVEEMFAGSYPLVGVAVREALTEEMQELTPLTVYPLRQYIRYPW